MSTKSVGAGFTTKTDKSGRVRLVKVYGYKKSAPQKIRERKSKRVRLTKAVKGFQRP